MSERSIAPSRRRLRGAARAGTRPRSAWLEVGLGWLCLAVALEWAGPSLATWLRDALTRGMQGAPMTSSASSFLPWLAVLPLAALASWWLAAAVSGRIQGHRRRGADSVRSVPAAPRHVFVLMMFMATIAAATVVGGGAGAARAPASSETGLQQLWTGWVLRLAWAMGVLATIVGALELVFAHVRLWRSLHMTPEDARELRRREGRG